VADQKRWFKVWASIALDPTFLSLPVEVIGRWTLLGAWIAAHGTSGAITASPAAIAHVLRCGRESILQVLAVIPSLVIANCDVTWPHGHEKPPDFSGSALRGGRCAMCGGEGCAKCRGGDPLEEWCASNGNLTVIMEKWSKYQEDSTVYERVKKWRESKMITGQEEKRREEKRREEKREKPVLKTLAAVVDKSTPWPTTLDDVRQFLFSIQAPDAFFNQTYWLRIDQWLGGSDSSVYYFEELKAYLAWSASQNGAHRHKDQLRGFRNWLSTCARWKERDAQRKAIVKRGSQSGQRV
jgi:hypothetical protein